MTHPPPFDGAIDRGLEEVIVCSSAISTIDGTTLLYRGYTIEDLANRTSFEEVIYLLWFGHLPSPSELTGLRGQLQSNLMLPKELSEALPPIPPKSHPMDYLAVIVAMLALNDNEANLNHRTATLAQTVRLTARIGTIIGAYQQLRYGRQPISTDDNRSIAWNLLRGITGKEPSSDEERALDVCLILHADHELNASAFSSRVTASTESGLYSSSLAAIGTLKGPLHGGANSAVMAMLREIKSVERVDRYLDEVFERGEKIMGFGHRVYKDGDPRARILRAMSARLTAAHGVPELFRISAQIEDLVKERKGLIPNVDFYSATVYHALGIPADLFTPVFAASRVAGWCAHVLEQNENNRIYRPRARYVGKRNPTMVAGARR
jgi:citrate synthase